MERSALVRTLKGAGYHEDRKTKNGHMVMVRDGHKVLVPGHHSKGNLGCRLVVKVLRAAGIFEDPYKLKNT